MSGNDDASIGVAEYDVSGVDKHATYLNRHVDFDHLAPALGCQAEQSPRANTGKTEFPDMQDVAYVARPITAPGRTSHGCGSAQQPAPRAQSFPSCRRQPTATSPGRRLSTS